MSGVENLSGLTHSGEQLGFTRVGCDVHKVCERNTSLGMGQSSLGDLARRQAFSRVMKLVGRVKGALHPALYRFRTLA